MNNDVIGNSLHGKTFEMGTYLWWVRIRVSATRAPHLLKLHTNLGKRLDNYGYENVLLKRKDKSWHTTGYLWQIWSISGPPCNKYYKAKRDQMYIHLQNTKLACSYKRQRQLLCDVVWQCLRTWQSKSWGVQNIV